MAIPLVNNSSILQPLTDFTDWCKTETANLKSPLSENDKWADIAKKVVILCSIIIPIIGLLTMVFSKLSDACKETPKAKAPAQAPPAQTKPKPKQTAPTSEEAVGPQAPTQKKSKPQPVNKGTQIKLNDFVDAVDSIHTFESNELASKKDQLDTYLGLREKIKEIRMINLHGKFIDSYLQVIEKIRLLDIAANINLESQRKEKLPPLESQ